MWRYCARQGRSARVDARVSRLRQRAMCGGGGVTMVVGSLCVRRRDRAMEPRKLKDQRRMQRLRARKRCAGLWGVSQHRARAPHATAAGGLRVIWPWCVAVWSKGPRSAEHAYICDVRRTAKVEWTCGTEHVYRQSVRYRGAHLRFCSLSRGLRACLLVPRVHVQQGRDSM